MWRLCRLPAWGVVAAVLFEHDLCEATAVVEVPAPGASLRTLQLLRSTGGVLDAGLDLQGVHLRGPNVSLTTRCLGGSVPGPAFAVFPGDVFRLEYANKLQAPVGGPSTLNSYHWPNMSNLHVHGLHVSPLPPGDDVLSTMLKPGDTWQYEYKLIPDHSPGTYWIHPHAHGSAVMQTGAGAAAPLIVLDPPGFLSPQLEELQDTVIMLQSFPRAILEAAATASQDDLFRIDRWDLTPEFWLVNGAPEPVLRVEAGRWQRLRLIAAGGPTSLHIGFGGCEASLLAKDGVYIDDFPRPVPRVSLPPGGRADVVVRCGGGEQGEVSRHTVASLPKPSGSRAKVFVGNLFSIEATGPGLAGLADDVLRPWAPPSRPRYLQDLRPASPDCSCATSMGLGGNTRWMSGHLWEGPKSYLHRSPQDGVVERHLSGVDQHPYHQHNFPFQLQSTPNGSDPYFKAGDWHDTYQNGVASQALVRFSTADFGGPQTVHCHILGHSDQGMIAVEMVRGTGEGACGCDLLDAQARRPLPPSLAAAEPAEAYVPAAAALAAAFLLASVGGALHVIAHRHDAAESYARLAGEQRAGPPRGRVQVV